MNPRESRAGFPKVICVNPVEKGSNFYISVISGIAVGISKSGERVSV